MNYSSHVLVCMYVCISISLSFAVTSTVLLPRPCARESAAHARHTTGLPDEVSFSDAAGASSDMAHWPSP